MKRGVKIFSLFLLISLVLCSFASVNAEDTNHAYGLEVNDINENIMDDALESDIANGDDSLESSRSLDDDLSIDDVSLDDGLAVGERDIVFDDVSLDDGLAVGERDIVFDDVSLDDGLAVGEDDTNPNNWEYDHHSGHSVLSSSPKQDLQVIGGLPFATLAQNINEGLQGGSITLISDYSFNSQTDQPYVFGVSIQPVMDLIINGEGHTIDGDFKAALFNILNAQFTVTFQNLNFINVGYSNDMQPCYDEQAPHGGGDVTKLFNAVRIVGSKVIFRNCTFMNNHCPCYGAISASANSDIDIQNCKFIENEGMNGAAFTVDFSCHLNLANSIFMQNNAKEDGGAIYIKESQLTVTTDPFMIARCNFTANSAGYNGGAICSENDGEFSTIIVDSNFTSNVAKASGGAVYLDCCANIMTSDFIQNEAGSVGGVYLGSYSLGPNEMIMEDDENQLKVHYCKFIDNVASDRASELFINLKIPNGLFLLSDLYVKSFSTSLPAVYFDSEYSALMLNVRYNSFVVPQTISGFCYMKFENLNIQNFSENWWGRNNPYENIRFSIEVDGVSYGVETPIDKQPISFRLRNSTLRAYVENEIEIIPHIGKYDTQLINICPYGIDSKAFSLNGVVRIDQSSRHPTRKSLYFTPTATGSVSVILTLDYETLTYEGTLPAAKSLLIWALGGLSIGVLVYDIVRIIQGGSHDESDDVPYFDTIEEAINNIEDGYAIIVPPGVYRGLGNVGLNINKNIIIMSDPNQTGDVIIDGEGKSWIWNISATNITILGLTFANGQTSGDGAALRFNSPLDNSTIVANFINNRAANGGAIYFGSTGGNITYSEFSSNQATYDGGAVYFSDGGKIGNVKFSYNKADRGGAIFQIGDLSKSNITYVSNSAKEGTNIFVVGGDDPNLGISVSDVTEGQPVFMEITTVAGYFGVVFVEINNARYDVNLVNGYGNLTVNSLRAGIYRVYVTFRGSEKYKISHITTEFEVHKKEHINPDLKISVANVTFGHPVLVEITALSNYSNNVSVMLNFNASKIYTVKVVNGYGNVSIENLAVGNYTAIAFSDAIGDFDAGSDFTNFEVSADDGLIDPNLIINVINPGADAPIVIEIFANSTYSGDVRVQIDPFIDYTANIKNGKGTVTLNGLFGGVYTVIVTLESDGIFRRSVRSAEFVVDGIGLFDSAPVNDYGSPSESVSMPVTNGSNNAKAKTVICAKNKAYIINYGGRYVITLKDAKSNALSGKKLALILDGKNIGSVKTNSKGVAAIILSPKVLKKIKAGKRKLVVKFAGDNEYDQASKTVKVALNKEKAKLLAKKKAFKRALKIKRYVVRLKDSKGKAIKKAKITLRLKGKTYNARTNKKGMAVFKIKKLSKKGKYPVKLKFKGNKYYNAVSKKIKIAVK